MASNIDFVLLATGSNLAEVVVSSNRSGLFSKERTGASQQFTRRDLQNIPIAGARTIDGITKYNANGNGNSFGAQDSRLNNFTIDGSQFNNSFGLGNSAQAGGRTGASAISLGSARRTCLIGGSANISLCVRHQVQKSVLCISPKSPYSLANSPIPPAAQVSL